MDSIRSTNADTALRSLEAAAVDEYETALIAERRAQGRYGRPNSPWPAMMFLGCTLMVVGTVLLFR